MQAIVAFLVEEPLLLLFIVAGLGYLLGNIKVKGISLGVAAVLFVGLAFGALSPDMKLPSVIVDLGLIIFVYTIGLSSGPGFFASFKRKGLRDNTFVFLLLLFAALLTVGAAQLFGLRSTVAAGMYAGSLTNTPALAGVLETVARITPAAQADVVGTEPVIGYSVAYPMGVIAMLIAVYVMQRVFRIDYRAEARALRQFNVVEQELFVRTVRVTNPEAADTPISTLFRRMDWDVVLSRLKHDGKLQLTTGETSLALGDLVNVVGIPEEVEKAVAWLGEPSGELLELDRSQYDFRRIFVSNPEIVGRSLNELDLPRNYGAIVSRVRRGDIDLLAHGDTVLELGDRVRLLAPREKLNAVARYFGDSYRALAEVDVLSFGLGCAAGLALGLAAGVVGGTGGAGRQQHVDRAVERSGRARERLALRSDLAAGAHQPFAQRRRQRAVARGVGLRLRRDADGIGGRLREAHGRWRWYSSAKSAG